MFIGDVMCNMDFRLLQVKINAKIVYGNNVFNIWHLGNNKLAMKYILIMQICSAIYQQCSEPMPNKIQYNSYYECSTAGYLNALTINQSMGSIEVNKSKVLINFRCQVVSTS